MLSKQEIAKMPIQVEHDTPRLRRQLSSSLRTKLFILLSRLWWYIVVTVLEIAAAVAIFAVPENAYPIVYARYALGLIFIFFLPGFAFTKALFPAKCSTGSSSESMPPSERVALSIGFSIVLAIVVGLVSYYAPWGIGLTSIVPILVILTEVFATVAVFREHNDDLNIRNLNPS